ncbi:MAG TPA: hypothetical protein VGF53_13880 [Pseudolabrys sp.]|jgi:hypothetical protein
MRALGRALAKLVAFVVIAATATCLYLIGANVYGYCADGPWTPSEQAQATMAKLADATLYPGSLNNFRELFGEPEHVEHSSSEINVDQYRWYRGAIRVRAAGDLPIRIEIGNGGWFDILPFGRPDFPGTFLDLRIGGPAPTPEQAAALRERAVACCEAALLKWGESGNRVTWIDYQRKVLRLKGY